MIKCLAIVCLLGLAASAFDVDSANAGKRSQRMNLLSRTIGARMLAGTTGQTDANSFQMNGNNQQQFVPIARQTSPAINSMQQQPTQGGQQLTPDQIQQLQQFISSQSFGGSSGAQQPGQFSTGTQTPGQFPNNNQQPGQFTTGTQTPGQFSTGTQTPSQFSTGTQTPGQFPNNNQQPGQFTTGTQTPGQFSTGTQTPSQFSTGTQTSGQFSTGTQTPGQFPNNNQQPSQFTTGTQTPGQFSTGTQTPSSQFATQQQPGTQQPSQFPTQQQTTQQQFQTGSRQIQNTMPTETQKPAVSQATKPSALEQQLLDQQILTQKLKEQLLTAQQQVAQSATSSFGSQVPSQTQMPTNSQFTQPSTQQQVTQSSTSSFGSQMPSQSQMPTNSQFTQPTVQQQQAMQQQQLLQQQQRQQQFIDQQNQIQRMQSQQPVPQTVQQMPNQMMSTPVNMTRMGTQVPSMPVQQQRTGSNDICSNAMPGDMLPHPLDETQFIICNGMGQITLMDCPNHTVFNPHLKLCDLTTEVPILCKSSPCLNGAKCVEVSPTAFQCECPQGFSGKTCEKFDTCTSSRPCGSDGVCLSFALGSPIPHVCLCNGGRSVGLTCDRGEQNPCLVPGSSTKLMGVGFNRAVFAHCEGARPHFKFCQPPLIFSPTKQACEWTV